jgi:nucleotide-binding universal stress UspA family protein
VKILVCTDGSDNSKKALEEAALIAEGCKANEVAVIHVYEPKIDPKAPSWGSRDYALTDKDNEYICKLIEGEKEERKEILDDAVKLLKEKNIEARAILEEGHPSHTIVNLASKEGFNMIVMGSRGLGGLKKVFLGSVSSAVIQEAENCTVAVVK